MKAVHTPFSIVKENALSQAARFRSSFLWDLQLPFTRFPLRPVRISAQRPMPILSS